MSANTLGADQKISSGRSDIADLVHRYSYNVRTGNAGECESLFTKDATYEVRELAPTANAATRGVRRYSGREAIGAFLAGVSKSGVRLCPLIHNLIIEIDGDAATSSCVMESRTWPTGHESIGEYEDRFRCIDGRWLFESRIFTKFLSDTVSHG